MGASDAGSFSAWAAEMEAAIKGEGDADVPCGDCTACCTSSQFIHIAPDESETLAHIPKALLFPAPRMPRGHVLMGYDEHGHCPMLIDNRCSIYAHRPRTCRTYDCRIFPATGLDPADDDRPLIAERAGQWRFEFPGGADGLLHEAVRSAAIFIREHMNSLPSGTVPGTVTQQAVVAFELRSLFLGSDAMGNVVVVVPAVDDVAEELSRRAAASARQRGD